MGLRRARWPPPASGRDRHPVLRDHWNPSGELVSVAVSVGHGQGADARLQAGVRTEAFTDPPTRRNRLWQADFSEFETSGAGTWNLGGVVAWWAKVNLACAVTAAKTTADAIGFLEAALAEVYNLLGIGWTEDLVDPDTGEVGKLRLVTDNGPCFKSARFAAWVASKRHIAHVRTRHRAPRGQRGDRAVLRSHQIRAPIPPRHRQRHPARSRGRLLPDDLQRHPTPPGHRNGGLRVEAGTGVFVGVRH